MVGRRALGIVLAELSDSGNFEPEFADSPSDALGLIDRVLVRVVPRPLDDTTPFPWRAPTDANYDVRGWCDQTAAAADSYATVTGVMSTYVLAESTEWVRLEWELPEERRTIQTAHGLGPVGGILPPAPRQGWEKSFDPVNDYPALRDLAWMDEELVVEGLELYSDPPWLHWLALHPLVGRRLGWEPDLTEPFCWHGADATWRARSIRRVRGQLSHQPPLHTCCAEGWQVVLSEAGLKELREAFGPLRRELLVERTLPARPRNGEPTAETSNHSVSLKEPG
jgi:hypothetical protein